MTDSDWQATVDGAVARRRAVLADGELYKNLTDLDGPESYRVKKALAALPDDVRTNVHTRAVLAGANVAVEILLPCGDEMGVTDEIRPRALVLLTDAEDVFRAVAVERARIAAITIEGYRLTRLRGEEQRLEIAERERIGAEAFARKLRWGAIDPLVAALLSMAAASPADDKSRKGLLATARAIHHGGAIPVLLDDEIEALVSEMAEECSLRKAARR